MPLTWCTRCGSYFNAPAVESHETSECPFCGKDLLLYKCYSCMGVSALDLARLPRACPRCHTILRGYSGALGFSQVVVGRHPLSDMLPPPSQRRNLILIHNDNPLKTSFTRWRTLRVLVFRGAGFGYTSLDVGGFAAVADGRFPMPTIIRDCWRQRNVTTRMQTKSVLAWSKSFAKATEYAYGCIKGAMGKVSPGYLYFACVEIGVDVTQEVRVFERRFRLPTIDEGTQKEVLTPTLPKHRILACWEVQKGKDFGIARITAKHVCETGVFAQHFVETYQRIDKMCQIGKEFDYYAIGAKIDQTLRV